MIQVIITNEEMMNQTSPYSYLVEQLYSAGIPMKMSKGVITSFDYIGPERGAITRTYHEESGTTVFVWKDKGEV